MLLNSYYDRLYRRMHELLNDRSLVERLRPDRTKVHTVEHNVDQLEGAYADLLGREMTSNSPIIRSAAVAPR